MIVVTPAGDTIEIGTVETAPTIGIVDYSRRVTDDFGVTTVVERGFARRMSVKLAVPSDAVDALQGRLADLRAVSAQWIADARFQSLSVTGFFKDFSINLAAASISYCTLTVEGLTVSEPITDTGADPAPEGVSSSLQMLAPVPITDQVLVAASVAEDDQPEWAAVTTYPLGARVMKAATHRVYESAAAGNVGNDPAGASGKWSDIGPTKRWAMFDQALGTATMASRQIVVTLAPGTPISALALLDVEAATVRVQSPGYDRMQDVTGSSVLFLDMPLPSDSITVTIDGPGALSVGTLLIGRLAGLGITEAAPSAGITDYSRKVVDDFGNVSVVERAFAKRMSVRGLIRTDAIDDVASRIAAVRARPSLWIGKAGLDTLTIYGFFKDFSIEAGQTVSKLSLTIEGLSKAPPLPKPLTSIVAQGSVDGVNWHLGLQPGDIFMRISNDSGKTFGNAVRVAGRDAFTAYLTNSDHTLPALYDGTVTSYAGAETVFAVGIAGQDLTDSGLFDLSIVANPQNLTVAISGRYFRVDGGLDAGEDSATLTARLTGKGQFAGVALDQVFSLAKSKGGADGAPAPLITLDASALTLRAGTDGGYIANQQIAFNAVRANLPGTTYFLLKNVDGNPIVNAAAADYMASYPGLWGSNGSDNLYLTSAGAAATMDAHGGAAGRFSVTAYVNGYPVTDTVSIQKVQDGAKGADGTSPYNAILSNESHTLPADAAGNVLSYAGAEFTLTVFYGSQDVTSSFRLDTVENPQGLFGPSDLYPTYRIDGGFDGGEPSASVTYHFIGKDGTPHAGKRVSKVFSLSKSLGGANGEPAALIRIAASSQQAKFDTVGNYVTGDIRFTATVSNSASAIAWGIYDSLGGSHSPAVHTVERTGAGPVLTLKAGSVPGIIDYPRSSGQNPAAPQTIRVRAWLADSGDTIFDQITVVLVRDGAKGADGAGAFTAYLTNSDHTVPASFDGTVTSYAGAESVFAIRLGAVDLTDSGQFDLSIVANPQNLTIATSGRYFRVDGGLDANEDGATITARLTGNGQYAGVVIDQVFTLSKSKGGRNGEPPALVSLSASGQTVRFDATGAMIAGQSVSYVATLQNVAPEIVAGWEVINSAGAVVARALASDLAGGAEGYYTSTGPNQLTVTSAGLAAIFAVHGGAAGRFAIRATPSNAFTPADTVSVQKVQDGAKGADGKNAVNVIADNETFTIPTDANGNYGTFPVDVSRGTLRVYDGVTEVTGSCTFRTGALFQLDGRMDGASYYAIGLYADTGYADYIATYRGVDYVARVTAAKVRNGPKGLDGVNPPLVTVSANPQAIRYDRDNNLSSGPTTFTAVLVNAIGPVAWSSAIGHGIYGTPGVTFSGNTMTLSPERMRDVLAYNEANFGVATETIVASASGVSDRVTVTKIRDGAKGADSIVPGPPGNDGFSLIASPAAFVVPSFSNGTSKPAWTGGSCRIALIKGGQEIAADSYSYAAVSNIASIAMSGQNITFADVVGDKGEFTARATRAGVSYDLRVTVVRTKDGSPAFKADASFNFQSNGGTASGSATVPGGRTLRISSGASYGAPLNYDGRCVIYIYWRNLSSDGPLNFLGQETGSIAYFYNAGTIEEPRYERAAGSVSISHEFVGPADSAQIFYQVTIQTDYGQTSDISGGIILEVI